MLLSGGGGDGDGGSGGGAGWGGGGLDAVETVGVDAMPRP